jgi:hypothetical protein
MAGGWVRACNWARGGTGMRMRSLGFAPSRTEQRIDSRSRRSGMIIVERKRAQERKKLQHQGGSLAGVVSGGGPPNVGTLLPQVTWRAGLWIKAAKMCQAPGPSLHGMLLGARLPVYILSYSCTSKREACPQPMLCIRTTYPEGKPMTLSRLHVDCRLSTPAPV